MTTGKTNLVKHHLVKINKVKPPSRGHEFRAKHNLLFMTGLAHHRKQYEAEFKRMSRFTYDDKYDKVKATQEQYEASMQQVRDDILGVWPYDETIFPQEDHAHVYKRWEERCDKCEGLWENEFETWRVTGSRTCKFCGDGLKYDNDFLYFWTPEQCSTFEGQEPHGRHALWDDMFVHPVTRLKCPHSLRCVGRSREVTTSYTCACPQYTGGEDELLRQRVAEAKVTNFDYLY